MLGKRTKNDAEQKRVLGKVLARELSSEEVSFVGGGYATFHCTGGITSFGANDDCNGSPSIDNIKPQI